MDAAYIAIDLKSFFASVECVDRQLDPLTTNLVVAHDTTGFAIPYANRYHGNRALLPPRTESSPAAPASRRSWKRIRRSRSITSSRRRAWRDISR